MPFLIPMIVAAADLLAVLSYMLGVTPVLGQGVGLGIKLLLLPLLFRPQSLALGQGPALFTVAGVGTVALALTGMSEWLEAVPFYTFLAHLSLTLLLTRNELPTYLRAVSYLIATAALIYFLMALAGRIPIIHGRHWYFHGLHPNLGSEIASAGVLCAVLSLRYRSFLIVSFICLTNTVLMQGRSAMLTIILVAVLRSMHEAFNTSDRSKVQFRIILATPIAVLGSVIAIPYIMEALLLTDRYRGMNTGIVGRTDQWELAWRGFLDSPLFGQGIGWFDKTQMLGAHNFFLHGLAEMGLLSVFLFGTLGYMAVTAYRLHGWKVVSLSPVLIMLMMNDRFINLNPYPFYVWFLLFALSAKPQPQVGAVARAPVGQLVQSGMRAAR